MEAENRVLPSQTNTHIQHENFSDSLPQIVILVTLSIWHVAATGLEHGILTGTI